MSTTKGQSKSARPNNDLVIGHPDIVVDGSVADLTREAVTTKSGDKLERVVLTIRLHQTGEHLAVESTSPEVVKTVRAVVVKRDMHVRVTYTVRCRKSVKEGKADRLFANLLVKDVKPTSGVLMPSDDVGDLDAGPVSLLGEAKRATGATGDVA